MKYTQKCPVCQKDMEGTQDHIDVGVGSGPICEDTIGCPGHYSYEYFYGGTRVMVGDKEFGYSYDTPAVEIHDIVCTWTKALEELRRQYESGNME